MKISIKRLCNNNTLNCALITASVGKLHSWSSPKKHLEINLVTVTRINM